MTGRTAAFVLCVVCAIVAALLLGGLIRPIVAGAVFAIALVERVHTD